MPNNGTTITAPVGIGDVQAVLNTRQRDLGRIIQTADINKWAKYKPVRYPQLFPADSTEWWKAYTGNCGLIIPIYSTHTFLVTDVNNGVEMWQYEKPRGGAYNEYYRLGDFKNYNHAANNPFNLGYIPSTIYKDSQPNLGFWLDQQIASATELGFSDITANAINLGNYYFGALVNISGTLNPLLITDSGTMAGDGAGGLEIPTSQLNTNATYDIIGIMTNLKQTTLGPVSVGGYVFIPVPANNVKQTVYVTTGGILVNVQAVWSNGNVSYTVYFSNVNSGNTASITSITLFYLYSNSKYPQGGGMEAGEGSIYLANQTVGVGQTNTLTGVINNVLNQYNQRGGLMMLQYMYAGKLQTVYGEFDEEQ